MLYGAKPLMLCTMLCNPVNVAHKASLSMELSRQEHWSGLPCPPPGYLPKAGIEPASLMSSALAGGYFTTRTTLQTEKQKLI